MICFKCNEFGHFSSRCPNNNGSDKNEKKEKKYWRNKDYKEKGKKSCYIVEEEHTESNSGDENEGKEVVNAVVKEDSKEERYENEKSLISHVRIIHVVLIVNVQITLVVILISLIR